MALTLKERPIIMIGPERSGTTLVMAMLGCHPRIAVPEVVWYYSRFHPYLHTYGDLSRPENFRTLATEMVHGLKTPYWGMKVNPRTIVDEIIASVREQSFAGLYAAMFERFAKEAGDKPRWGEKTPYNLFFIGPILKDFPGAQFIYITRDGRDASADYLESSFGPANIYSAATVWKMCMNAAAPWREKLGPDQWFDISYEELVRRPEEILRGTCDFLGEEFHPQMMDFHRSDIGVARGRTEDHKPLGSPVSDKYIGIYKDLLSLRDQRIFAAVAGKEMEAAGYELDVEPEMPSASKIAKYEEWDGRIRAATLDGPEGHIVYESYNDWLIDQREERRKKGLWSEADVPADRYPLGTPEEELVMGQRAWRRWKTHFSIKRDYDGELAL